MITAYLKPTNYCNVGCSHCYLPESVRANKEKMSDETLEKVMIFLNNMKKSGKHEKIFIIWHGGEPLILSPDYFENAGKIIDKNFLPGQIIEGIQTSLIPYKREFAKIVKERWNSEMGSSMDFSSRILKGSPEEYQKLWMKKVDLARDDDILIMPGMTPGKKDCYNTEYIYKWFNERHFWIWNIDRYSNVAGDLPDFSTNREHAKFLKELFDLCFIQYQKTGFAPMIKPIAAVIGGILNDMPGDRWGGSCQSDFVVINPDGKLNNCPDKDSFEESYGNLFQGFSSFESSPMRKKWIRIQQAGHRINECTNCENASWCKSGCPITGNACEVNGVQDECSGFKSFINHVRDFISKSPEHLDFVKKYQNYDLLPQNIIKPQTMSVEFAN